MDKRVFDAANIAVIGIAFLIMTIIVEHTMSNFGIIFQTIGFLILMGISARSGTKYEECRKPVKIVAIALVVFGLVMQLSVSGL